MATVQKSENAIILKGSAKLVTDYLHFGINSILFQRGIYPPETFKHEEHFGLTIYVSTDKDILNNINTVLGQIKDWLLQEKVQKLSMIINNRNTKEVLERWDFKLQYEKSMDENNAASLNTGGKTDSNPNDEKEKIGTKDIKVIQREIRDVLRQITSTVSFLPLLDAPCEFDCLVFTTPDTHVPENWKETEPVFIANSQEVQLRSFSTSLHKMDTVVSYKQDD
uniref:Mitotic spindle assembly checkpoint protein MAD2A n=1 Tax=Cacopsylla melanoneura TaxID=428564 RepID=A0A8D9E368_9HEMI